MIATTTAPGADAGTGELAKNPSPETDDAAGASRGTEEQARKPHRDSSTTPDRAAILETLATLFRPDDTIELRAFPKGRKRTAAGYFDFAHREQLADHAIRLNKAGASVYAPLNPIDPQLLGRFCNRIEEYAGATATDANVIRRLWLLLDFDPIRPKDTSATDAQLEDAKVAARACYHALQDEGWPDPIVCWSGNGVHLLYPIDLPNDDASRDLVKNALAGLAERFDTATVKLDRGVFNAGRITKLYGTVANKGDSTATTPHRLSRIVSTPDRSAVVTVEQLRAVAPAPGKAKRLEPDRNHNGRVFDFDGFLDKPGSSSSKTPTTGASGTSWPDARSTPTTPARARRRFFGVRAAGSALSASTTGARKTTGRNSEPWWTGRKRPAGEARTSGARGLRQPSARR